jgi:electron transport complex protein RnfG
MGKIIQLTLTLTVIAALAGISIGSIFTKTEATIVEGREQKLTNALSSLFPKGALIVKDSVELESTKYFWIATGKKGSDDTVIVADSGQDSTAFDTTIVEGKPILLGYALKGGKFGYSSVIKFIVAVSPQKEILGLSILSQEETPGLGSRTTETLSDATFWNGIVKKFSGKLELAAPWFQTQFKGLSLATPIVINKGAEWHTMSDESKSKLTSENSVTSITGATISTVAISDAIGVCDPLITRINDYLSESQEQ